MPTANVNHLSEQTRSTSIMALNALLSDAIDPQLAAKQAQWTLRARASSDCTSGWTA